MERCMGMIAGFVLLTPLLLLILPLIWLIKCREKGFFRKKGLILLGWYAGAFATPFFARLPLLLFDEENLYLLDSSMGLAVLIGSVWGMSIVLEFNYVMKAVAGYCNFRYYPWMVFAFFFAADGCLSCFFPPDALFAIAMVTIPFFSSLGAAASVIVLTLVVNLCLRIRKRFENGAEQ